MDNPISLNLKKHKKDETTPPPVQKITVYFNDIPVLMLDWMEIRHALYKQDIPFGYRDGVLSGEMLVCDSEGFVKEVGDRLKADEHYFIFPADQADFVEEEIS